MEEMMNEKRNLQMVEILSFILFLFLNACGGPSTSISPATATPAPPTVTLTPTPSPTPSPTPTLTPTPSPTPSPTPTLTPTPESPVSISGTITNMSDAKQFLSEKSFLQLIRVSDKGTISFAFNADGTTSLDSDLAQIPLPSEDGFFDFRMESIEPGKYFISAQKFIPSNGMNFNAMVIGTDPNDPKSIIAIDIPDDITLPFHLELGDVAIILP
jgi:hypothetical protein